ncbi:MAG TPA: UPF0182 family protein [Candidatus Limnocylindria bacterium]|nr:UPF0182 family protein [Candidatus Limnocylindria bacterium]
MSSWFDRLLEDLQRRQEEADARREGRPFERRERNVTPIDGGRGGRGNGHDRSSERGGGGGGGGRGGGIPPVASDVPWRRWILIGGAVVILLVVLGLLGGVVNLVTDVMWYDALGRRDILTTRLFAQIGLFAIGFVAMLVPVLLSVWLARRIAPQAPVRQLGGIELPDASRLIGVALVGLAVLLALGSGAAWSGAWETVLLFANGRPWDVTDPTLGRDIGFYVFDLPFWRFLLGWASTALIVIGLVTLATYAVRALRWQFRLTAPVRAHLSVIGALLLIVVAAGYQLDIAELAYSTRGLDGRVQAALFTDMNAQLPAYVILTVVALVSAALLLLNTWFRTLWLLGLAAGSWIVLSVLVGGLYPSFVQTVQVEPNELSVERPYIRNHIEATRAAFDLDTIETRRFTGEQDLTRELFEEEEATIDNLRLWDYRPLLTTFGQQQILRFYYDFLDVDIDRYEIGGEMRQIMLSARELDVENFGEDRTWTNERLVYTHGFGITAVPVDAVTPQGTPDYLVSGINREPQLPIGQPRIYFGEKTDTWVVTNTTTNEFDYPIDSDGTDGGSDATTVWEGTTGVDIGNPINRLLFALRFSDFNLLISGQLTGDSEVLFRRNIEERVQELAPFLVYDGDPYLVSADERLLWVWDAYTLTNRYPNAQPLPADTGRYAGANYMRNSVKVVVDAYNGTVRFFLADPDEPIVAAYARIFPTLFEPMSAMPQELEAHLRYPEDLFVAQNQAFRLYHLAATERGATTFYNQDDRWAIPIDQQAGGETPMEPYYVIMRIPGEEEAEFALIQPMVPEGRPNMIAWVAARMDPGVYGERIAFQFPTGTTTAGPVQVESRITSDSAVSEQFTLWSSAGSRVVRGNLLVLPIGEDALLYVEPIFLQAEGAPFPEFVRVIMADQERIAFAETVEDGLAQLLGEAEPPPPEPPEPGEPGEPGESPEPSPSPGESPGGSPGELPSDVAALVAEANRLYAEAQAALERGDLGTYQARIDDLEAVLEALAELTGE